MANLFDSLNFGVRTLRDTEEENRTLKNDNFNLKMRIFYLEEELKLRKNNNETTEDLDNSIELKIQNETLKFDLEQKIDLCVQARKVIEILEAQKTDQYEIQQRIIDDLSMQVEILNDSKEELESIIKNQSLMEKTETSTLTEESMGNKNLEMTFEMEEEIANLREQNEKLTSRNDELEQENGKLSKKINDLSHENSKLRQNLDECKSSLEKQERKNTLLKKTLNESKARKVEELSLEIETLRKMNKKVQDHSDKLTSKNCECQKLLREQSDLMKKLNKTIEGKNAEIQHMKETLEKMDQNKHDDCSKSEVSSDSSTPSLTLKKSKKFLHLPKRCKKPETESASGSSDNPSGTRRRNFLWNPLFGYEYMKHYPK